MLASAKDRVRYTDEQLQENYERFIEAIKTTFSGDRLEKLLHMYSMEEMGPNLMFSPASGNKFYHNAYEGGYIDHVINVARNSLRVLKVFESAGAKIDFTNEELLFAAFHHDLGKLGEKGEMYYTVQTSNWHIENKGELYVWNDELDYLTHTDRTFLTLGKYGIGYNQKEFFGMKFADGMYDEDNVKYLKTFDIRRAPRTKIGYVLHFADQLSTLVERQDVSL